MLAALILYGIIAVLFYKHFGIPCIFQKFLGIPCPGCGMTRALVALLHFDFAGALKLNAGIYVMPVVILLIFKNARIFANKYLNICTYILCAGVFLAQWLVKLLAL